MNPIIKLFDKNYTIHNNNNKIIYRSNDHNELGTIWKNNMLWYDIEEPITIIAPSIGFYFGVPLFKMILRKRKEPRKIHNNYQQINSKEKE